MFATSVSGMGYCIQPNYYRTPVAIEEVSQNRSGPRRLSSLSNF